MNWCRGETFLQSFKNLYHFKMSIFAMFSRETSTKTEKRKLGDKGEDFFVKHLVKHNYKILDRNYLKKWGEIDVVAKKDNIFHFFEVKTVRRKLYGKENLGFHDPEENVHKWKRQRLARTIETYLAEKRISEDAEWQADVAAVFLDLNTGEHTIRITEDIDLI